MPSPTPRRVAERVREKLHRERLKAIEKGLPPPDSSFDEALLLYLADGTPGTDAGAARMRNRTLESLGRVLREALR